MSRLFYAWEFGANLGHIAALLPFGRALRDKGYTLDWAVTQTGPAARLLQREGFGWLQAPVMPEVRREGPPLSYADILLRFGYADAEDLLGLVVAWRELLKLTGTRLVLADHAPTAVLAAQTLDIPVMLFSNGFTVPPRMRPLPNMRPWNDVPVETLLALEDVALASVNKVLTGFGKSRLDALWQIFAVAEETMITYPELDHYDNRGPARYWGSLPNASIGIAPPGLPSAGGASLPIASQNTHCEAMVAALHAAGQPTVIYLPGASDAFKSKWQAPHLIFSPQPADLGLVAQDVNMAVTYSSLATTTAFLFAGKPLLLLPSHLEQFLLAKRVTELGAGVLVNPEQADVDLLAALRSVLTTPALTENAQAFAAKYAAFSAGAGTWQSGAPRRGIVSSHPFRESKQGNASMISRLTGMLLEKNPPLVTIDVQGIGYEVGVPMSTFYNLPATGERTSLYTHFVVREDGQYLYGFLTDAEREAFGQSLRFPGLALVLRWPYFRGFPLGNCPRLSPCRRPAGW